MQFRFLARLGLLLATGLCLTDAAWAQRGRRAGPEYASRFFDNLDRNQDKILDANELKGLPAPMQNVLEENGVNLSQSVTREKFLELGQAMTESFGRGRFGDRRSRGGRGFGSSESRSAPDRPNTPFDFLRRTGSNLGNVSNDESSDQQAAVSTVPGVGSSSAPGSTASGTNRSTRTSDRSTVTGRGPDSKTKRMRLTVDLPEKYTSQDKDHDGQIALYEWDRSAFAEFMRLDRNQDGFLTPRELVLADSSTAPGSSRATTTANRETAPGGAVSSTGGAVPSNTGGATTTPPLAGSQSARQRRDRSRASDEPAISARTQAPTEEESTEVKRGRFLFGSLDVDKDGQISSEEWGRSRIVRRTFERAAIEVPLPVSEPKFLELYVQASSTPRR